MSWDTPIVSKTCNQCKQAFDCGLTEGNSCWCAKYPPIFEPDPAIDCYCPACFYEAIKLKIDFFVSEMTPERAKTDNKAKGIVSLSLMEGIDYYLENGNYVFTSWYHLKRGSCCGNDCRHCPYSRKE